MAAVFDSRDNVLVIGVVYDGPPEAGKTTSLKALASGLGRPLYTPEEIDGRTTYFDWMEYTGGRFEGAEIRCQVISVPGQQTWAERRRVMIDEADVVVFVGDTSPAGWPATLERLRELREYLDRRAGPPVGVVFQANKRDVAGAAALSEIREQLGRIVGRIGIVESIAHQGSGIREAFVFGVRLALDRVRELQRTGELREDRHFVVSGEVLFERLRALELEAPPAAVETPLRRSESFIAVARAETSNTAVRAPTPEIQSGLIWPPVEGRIILHEAAQNLRVATTLSGDFLAGHGTHWRVFSRAAASYADLEEGRAALIAWARQHSISQPLLSSRRSVVLAEDDREVAETGGWRLWQIVHMEPSLGDVLSERLHAPLEEVAAQLLSAGRVLMAAQRRMENSRVTLPCGLRTIGQDESGHPMFVGLMPSLDEAPLPPSDATMIAWDLARLIDARIPTRLGPLARAIEALPPARLKFNGANELAAKLIAELEQRAARAEAKQ